MSMCKRILHVSSFLVLILLSSCGNATTSRTFPVQLTTPEDTPVDTPVGTSIPSALLPTLQPTATATVLPITDQPANTPIIPTVIEPTLEPTSMSISTPTPTLTPMPPTAQRRGTPMLQTLTPMPTSVHPTLTATPNLPTPELHLPTPTPQMPSPQLQAPTSSPPPQRIATDDRPAGQQGATTPPGSVLQNGETWYANGWGLTVNDFTYDAFHHVSFILHNYSGRTVIFPEISTQGFRIVSDAGETYAPCSIKGIGWYNTQWHSIGQNEIEANGTYAWEWEFYPYDVEHKECRLYAQSEASFSSNTRTLTLTVENIADRIVDARWQVEIPRP